MICKMAVELVIGNSLNLFWPILGLLLTYAVVEYFRRNRNLPPGPNGLPFIGYFLSLRRRPEICLKGLAKVYGDVFSFRTLGGTLVVVLSDLEIIKDVLINRHAEFTGRPAEETVMRLLDDGDGIAHSEGQIWKEQRRFVLHSGKDFGFGTISIEPTLHRLINKMVNDIKQLKGRPFHPYFHVCHVACNVISKILYGKEFPKEQAEFQTIIKHVNDIIKLFTDSTVYIIGMCMKYMMNFYTAGVEARYAKRKLWTLTKEIIDDHEKKFDSENIHDFVDAYLYHMKTLQGKGQLKGSTFSRDRLDAISIGLFLEGSGSVTSATLGYISKLSQYSDVQKKAQEELDREIGRDRIPSWLDRGKLPYLNAVLQELYRTSSVFIFSNIYNNYEETQIKGYRIPKRSIIIANLYALNHDPKLYPEPEKFDPERFWDKSGKPIKNDGPFAFGVGKRACIGKPLSQMEVFSIIAALLQNFTLFPAEEGQLRAVPR